MRYFYDCEFIDDGRIIDLISLGMVSEDGSEFYAVSTEFDPDRAGKWVRANVFPKLPPPSSQLWRSRRQIRDELLTFLIQGQPNGEEIQLWAWTGAYDHVVLCQLWGPMTALPRIIPRFTRELRQYWESHGSPPLPPLSTDAHNALVDARHNLAKFQAITSL